MQKKFWGKKKKKTMIIITKLNLSTAVIGLTLERYQLQGRVK